MKEKSPICFKIVLVGEAQTGKTQIMRRFVFNQFSSSYQTSAINFEVKKFTDSKGRFFKVEIWDACGQDKACVIPYIKAVHIIGIVIDGSRKLEAAKLSKWLDQIKKTPHEAVFICLIVNKTDLIENFDKTYKNALRQQLRVVLKGNAHNLENTPIFYCSAKTGYGIEKIFHTMTFYFAENHFREPNQSKLPQKVAPVLKLKNAELSLPFWEKISDTLFKHKFLVGSNSLLVLGAVILLIVATLPMGSFLAVGLPFSAVTMAFIIAGVSLILWNIGYAMGHWLLKFWNHHEMESSQHDREESLIDFFSLPQAQEAKKTPIQNTSASNQKRPKEVAYQVSTLTLK